MEESFIKVCTLDELKSNHGKRFIINETEIAIFKIDHEVFAVSNICPHQHTALIYDGFIEEGFVVCPAHGWMFNLKTGKMPVGNNGLRTFPVKIENENVFVEVKKKDLNW